MAIFGSPRVEIDRDEAGEVWWDGRSSGMEVSGLGGIARDVTRVRLRRKGMRIRDILRWICILLIGLGLYFVVLFCVSNKVLNVRTL